MHRLEKASHACGGRGPIAVQLRAITHLPTGAHLEGNAKWIQDTSILCLRITESPTLQYRWVGTKFGTVLPPLQFAAIPRKSILGPALQA